MNLIRFFTSRLPKRPGFTTSALEKLLTEAGFHVQRCPQYARPREAEKLAIWSAERAFLGYLHPSPAGDTSEVTKGIHCERAKAELVTLLVASLEK